MNKPDISIETLDMRIIYIRHKGSYASFRKVSGKLVKKLFAYAQEENLIHEGVTKVMTIYNDNPFITDSDNLRTSVAMSIPHDAQIIEREEICESRIKGKFGVGSFMMNAKEYGDAWNSMYQDWLFKEDVVARDAAPFELYVEEPPRNYRDASRTNIYIPIE